MRELETLKEEIENNKRKIFLFMGPLTLYLNKNFDEYLNQNIKKAVFKTNLNPNYTLENYIVGDNNQIAYRLALALIDGETKYSPLLIYGIRAR